MKSVRVAQLLQMVSGLDFESDNCNFDGPVAGLMVENVPPFTGSTKLPLM